MRHVKCCAILSLFQRLLQKIGSALLWAYGKEVHHFIDNKLFFLLMCHLVSTAVTWFSVVVFSLRGGIHVRTSQSVCVDTYREKLEKEIA